MWSSMRARRNGAFHCEKLVNLMDGSISVKSEFGAGTEFPVCFTQGEEDSFL